VPNTDRPLVDVGPKPRTGPLLFPSPTLCSGNGWNNPQLGRLWPKRGGRYRLTEVHARQWRPACGLFVSYISGEARPMPAKFAAYYAALVYLWSVARLHPQKSASNSAKPPS
jgi:hypothetical protein